MSQDRHIQAPDDAVVSRCYRRAKYAVSCILIKACPPNIRIQDVKTDVVSKTMRRKLVEDSDGRERKVGKQLHNYLNGVPKPCDNDMEETLVPRGRAASGSDIPGAKRAHRSQSTAQVFCLDQTRKRNRDHVESQCSRRARVGSSSACY